MCITCVPVLELKTEGVSHYWDKFGPVRSFDTKAALRISRKPFDLESPNFTVASMLALSTAVLEMTSLSTSDRRL